MPEQRDRFAQLLVKIWDDPDWVARSARAQWFYMLLLSQPKLNKAGIISLTIDWWATLAANSNPASIESAIAELEEHRFIVVDRLTQELFVRTYIRNSGVVKQPNVLKRALREAREVHSRKIKVALAKELRRLNLEMAEEVADDLDPDPSPVKANANPSGKASEKGSAASQSTKTDNSRSEATREGFAEPLGEGFREPFAEPRGVGKGLGSSSPVDINSGSKTSSSDDASLRPDVDRLCTHLHAAITGNGSKATITEKWRTEARLLLDRDKRPPDEAAWLIEWCQNDPFWNSNILSMPTFRKQYDRLRIQAQQATSPPPRRRAIASDTVDAELDAAFGAYEQQHTQPHLRALPRGA